MSAPAFNLKSLESIADREELGAWVDVENEIGEPMFMGGQFERQLRIKVVGTHSHRFRALEAKARDRAVREGRRGIAASADVLKERELVDLAEMTLEWEAAIDDNGTEIPLSIENAAMLYRVAPHVFRQINQASDEHRRFFPSSSSKP